MKARRRLSDSKLARDTVDTGGAEAVAFGTMAAGLVIGTMEQLSPAWSVAARYGHGEARPSAAATHADAVPPPAQAGAATLDHALPIREPMHQAELQPHVQDAEPRHEEPAAGSSAEILPVVEPAHEMAADSQAAVAAVTASPAADEHVTAPTAAIELVAPETAIAGIAQHISEAMTTLVDQIKTLPTGIDGLSTLVQHATDIGAIAGQMVEEISSAALKGVEGLSEVLGGPAIDVGTIGHALDLPAAILGASSHDAVLPALDMAPQHVDAAMPVIDHVVAPVVELPPLQLGFLGQSYADTADHHDNGSHSLNSPLHGFI